MPILLLIILLGIVEGVTEYLPVSSTGHLILATELLGFRADDWALFNVAIQPGAIVAILVLYWRTFRDVVVGVALGDYIDMLLENAVVVGWALIIGGIAILIVEKFAPPTESGGVAGV